MPRFLAVPFLAIVLSAQAQPELVVSVGHAGAPSLAAFAGGHLATASMSNVALIDVATGLTIAHLPQVGHVMAIQANPQGDLIAVGTCDHSVHVWDVKLQTLVRRIPLDQECADAVSFSPDGALLATAAYGCCAGAGGGLQIWNVGSGALMRELAKDARMRSVVFSRDGRWLVGVDDNGKATVFEWPSGQQLRAFDGIEGAGGSESAGFTSPDGQYFGWLGMRQLRVWDVKTGAEVALPGARSVTISNSTRGGSEGTRSEQQVTATTAEFLNDGRLAYVDDNRLLILTLPAGPMQELPLEQPKRERHGDVFLDQSPSWRAIRSDGRTIAGTYGSRTVVWDTAARKLRDLTSPALTEASSLEWSRFGVVAWADFESGVRAWSDRAGELVDLAVDVHSAQAMAFHPDGHRLAVSDLSSIHIIDVQRRRSVTSLEIPATLRPAVAFSPDGSRVVFKSSEGLALFDDRLRPQRQLERLGEHTSADYIALSPDGRWVAAGLGGPQQAVKVWPATQAGDAVALETSRLSYGPQPPAFSSDSRWLASFSKGESLMLWSTGSWKVERMWRLAGTGRALAFAPQGSRLAIAVDREAAIWDATTGGKLATLTTPGSSNATQVAWSPDGNRVVTAADDGVLRFWNASNGQLLASLYTLASGRDWLLVAPDGRVDGSDRALATLVAWRTGDRVSLEKGVTDRRRVRHLWQNLSSGVGGR